MSPYRPTLVFALVSLLAGSLLIAAGCRAPGARKSTQAGTTAPKPVVVAKVDQPPPPPPAVVAKPAPVVTTPPPVVTVRPAPETKAAPAAPPGFWSRLFGSRNQTSSADSAASQNPVPVVPPAIKADPNKTYVPYRIQLNDTLLIALRGITPEQPNIELVVDENGEIRMPYINNIKAEGLTPTELENQIHDTYLSQKIYKRISVNVIVPAMTQPTFYVKGEVRSPGRMPYVNGMTLLTAIAASGGPTDFASDNMELVRGGKKIKFNYYDLEKHPEKDQAIQAGDIVIVPKSLF